MADDKSASDSLKFLAEVLKQRKGGLPVPGGIANPSMSVLTDAGLKPEETWQMIQAWVDAEAKKKAAETNEVDLALANSWFAANWPGAQRKCIVCTHDNWVMGPKFAHVPMGLIGTGPVGTYQPVPTFPAVVVTCRTCGHTLFFNAIAMKLLPDGAP
ncbi:MAG: hypothetical protein ACLQAT_22490 [Candidatus Binataceae bacterium]